MMSDRELQIKITTMADLQEAKERLEKMVARGSFLAAGWSR